MFGYPRLVRALIAASVFATALVASTTLPAAAQQVTVTNPVVKQRADTAIIKHTDGYYYMTASVPDYKRVELRRATTLQGLGSAATSNAFVAPASGPLSGWIWAPDIRFYDGAWYMYFSASPSTAQFEQRLYWVRNTSANPMTGTWSAPQRLFTNMDGFTLDPASFTHNGVRYLVWAQAPATTGSTNIYIARMNGATAITGTQVSLSAPTLAWEREGVAVNEAPQVIVKNGRVFLGYSASATDSRYKMGLLSAPVGANLLNAASWTKSSTPVFQTANGVYGPGHGSFTVAEDNQTDILVYHARDYATPTPDALRDPNRHTRMQQLLWQQNGQPYFGLPQVNGVTPTNLRGQHSNKCVDNYDFDTTPGALVRLWDCSGNTAQQFDLNYLGNNYYRVINKNTGTCLDNANGSTANNANVGLVPCNGTTAQQWGLIDRGNGWFSLRNVAGNMCLDNYEWNTANGARISLWPCNGLAAQNWHRG